MGVGPSTKETSLHHFRDPLVEILSVDPDINFLGIVVAGTPQSNKEKEFVSRRTGELVNSMQADGAIVSTDGWGNSDIDFSTTLEEIGDHDISVIGLKFIGKQAKFVVENQYTDFVLDINKSTTGTETEVVGENTLDKVDAKKALAALKLKMRRDLSD
ncbi:glycine/sarcosine/betaine reductase component B subunit [Vagococcus zengguangii]|uniref:Proline reductase n=1 Tax=Vagococcus zengguangii TaxID=2571750 RepID=A0A4D7D0A6_9ENTE|nr:glycine/sarcosine/betaine reductase component B subunit [Vagococcus zengguangii]QCI87370.1 proline reductase [Vagococcus zengguangii]